VRERDLPPRAPPEVPSLCSLGLVVQVLFFCKGDLTLLYFTLLYFTLLYFALLYFTFYFALLCITLLYFALLYFTLLYFTYFSLLYPDSPRLRRQLATHYQYCTVTNLVLMNDKDRGTNGKKRITHYQHCTVLYCTVLDWRKTSTVLYCTVLYCTRFARLPHRYSVRALGATAAQDLKSYCTVLLVLVRDPDCSPRD
jgi:hypothetical protein